MKIGDIVSFQQENFFEGAVQLRWLTDRPSQARQAAEAFVFHGPRYHAAAEAETDGIEGSYRLKDSASFVQDLLTSLQADVKGQEQNPFWLVVAGYGAGKSHLALTCASLLSDPLSSTSAQVIRNLTKADEAIAADVQQRVANLERPVLVLPLDGMSGFHLGNALTQVTLSRLQQHGVDTGAIHALSPRFQIAEQFVERNFALRREPFATRLPGWSQESICQQLQQHNEDVYSVVDRLYSEANGSAIPLLAQESAQELLNTLSEVYCGPNGHFSSVVILFDEFGRYLEYAAEKPALAGDSALQQLFQGVQDNSQKLRFIGFIQYELKAYLQRFSSSTDLRHLQRYITRFDSAQKWYLSTNLETLFAHMIGKQQVLLQQVWQQTQMASSQEESRQLMQLALPGYRRLPVWNEAEKFARVIAQGCWPLHPLASWFLTRQRDVVQSRSALTFIKDMLERVALEAVIQAGRLRQVSAAELVLQSMLPEMIAAERQSGGTVAETLQLLLEKFQAHLHHEQRLVLAGVAILERMRVGKLDKLSMNRLLAEACVLPAARVAEAIHYLERQLGALEWNQDLSQYELIADATTRGQFQQWLRQQQARLNPNIIREIFMGKGLVQLELENRVGMPDFAANRRISTLDWQFKPHVAHSQNLEKILAGAFQDWQQAHLPTEAKGQVVYVYVQQDDDIGGLESKLQRLFQQHLLKAKVTKAPVWVIALKDTQARLAEHLGRLYLFETTISEGDKERFRRFIPEEQVRSQDALRQGVAELIQQRLSWGAGIETLPDARLRTVANFIFEQVYPQALPFLFDGFGSSVGNGAVDCAQLNRSLIAKQVNFSWIQAQNRKSQNRFSSLLGQTWHCLSPSSGQLIEPGQTEVQAVYQRLVKLHQEQLERTLLQSWQLLLAPPYGMNASSAGLLLGLLLGLEIPPRQIIYQAKAIPANDWLQLAFPANKGKHFLDQTILAQSRLQFLSLDSIGRWRQLLQQWEVASRYDDIIRLADEVERRRKLEPLPEQFVMQYRDQLERSKTVREQLQEVQQAFEQVEKNVERAERQNDVGQLLKASSQLLAGQKRFESEGCWPDKFQQDYGHLLAIVRDMVVNRVEVWIPHQRCNGVLEILPYRERLTKGVRSLEALMLKHYATTLETWMLENIKRAEEREKIRNLLIKSEQYPQQPPPSASTLMQKLRDDLTEGDQLIEALSKVQGTLSATEMNERVEAIKQRQQLLRERIQLHREGLGRLYTKPLTSYSELDGLLVQVKRWEEIFVDTKDAQETQNLRFQLEYIKADVSSWESGQQVSVERLAELLQHQVTDQLSRLEAQLEEQNIDPAWDLETIYASLLDERVTAACARSQAWLAPRLISLDAIQALSTQQCAQLEQELAAAPAYLAMADQQQVNGLLSQLKQHREILVETQRQQQVKAWQATFLNLTGIEQLSKQELEKQLKRLCEPSVPVMSEEMAILKPVENQLIYQLDKISVEDIMARIARLPIKTQQQICLNLSKRLLEQQDA